MLLPRQLTPDDYHRTYELPDDVDTNISRAPQLGEPGALWAARGILLETSRHLSGRPLRLRYAEHRLAGSGRHVEVAVTAEIVLPAPPQTSGDDHNDITELAIVDVV
jgi:hypothetical protein